MRCSDMDDQFYVVDLINSYWVLRSRDDIMFEVREREQNKKQITNRKSRVMEDMEADCLVKFNLSADRTKQNNRCKVVTSLEFDNRFVRWMTKTEHSFSVVRAMKSIMCRV